MLPVAMARSFCYSTAIRYILHIEWITSCSDDGANGPESNTTRTFREGRQVVAPGVKLLHMIADLLVITGKLLWEQN